ncbi:hypothetical protein [Pseudomonas putida]|jgi:hypothetical protein|uniref:Uncharacterized protein n=1 Tax=Pseudomonas putida TaxID=303 RepID=A0A1Q9R9N1_PSEPU|nr:hypothetical protein [Pseudomonas putida]OLS64153.1 hypothetical protein PSEMO_09660 [Pseudomonas putida]
MAIQKFTKFAFLVVLSGTSAYTHAAMPESCFQSKQDYDNYLKYGYDDDRLGRSEEEFRKLSPLEILALRESAERAIIQKKAISINVKQHQTGNTLYADASGSTTPSGQMAFAWGSQYSPSSTASEFSTPAGSPGTYSNVRLAVYDTVCDLSASTQIRMTSQ